MTRAVRGEGTWGADGADSADGPLGTWVQKSRVSKVFRVCLQLPRAGRIFGHISSLSGQSQVPKYLPA